MGQTCHVASMHTACAHDPRGQQANTLHAYVQVSTCKLPWDETCIVLHSSVVHAYTYPLVVSLSPSQCMRNIMQQLMQRVGRVLTRLTTDYKATMISNIYTHTHTHTHIEWLNARSWRTHRVERTHTHAYLLSAAWTPVRRIHSTSTMRLSYTGAAAEVILYTGHTHPRTYICTYRLH